MIITKAIVVKELTDAIKKDQANRYRLVKDWTLPKLNRTVLDYHGKLIDIVDSVITVKAYDGDTCNGATLAPDRIWKWDIVPATIFHDPWYAEISEIATWWDCPEAEVRKLGDEIFGCILVATGVPEWLARAYLTGVRWFGWAARIARVAIFISILAGAGCSGCAVIPDHFGDEPVTPPDYEDVTPGK